MPRFLSLALPATPTETGHIVPCDNPTCAKKAHLLGLANRDDCERVLVQWHGWTAVPGDNGGVLCPRCSTCA